MGLDPINERYKDSDTIIERNLTTWLWLWLPIYALITLTKEVIALRKERQSESQD